MCGWVGQALLLCPWGPWPGTGLQGGGSYSMCGRGRPSCRRAHLSRLLATPGCHRHAPPPPPLLRTLQWLHSLIRAVYRCRRLGGGFADGVALHDDDGVGVGYPHVPQVQVVPQPPGALHSQGRYR